MINNKKILCTIPAKKHSRRLPNKNIRELNGIPLINITVNQALKSKYVDLIVVNTDSDRIKELVKGYNTTQVRVLDRSEDAIGNDVGAEPVAIDSIKQINDNSFDIIVWLPVTSPLRAVEDIDNAIELFIRNKDVCLYSVFENDILPNGAVYVASVDYIMGRGSFSCRFCLDWGVDSFYVMPFSRSVDVDTLFDFKIAEMMSEKGRLVNE